MELFYLHSVYKDIVFIYFKNLSIFIYFKRHQMIDMQLIVGLSLPLFSFINIFYNYFFFFLLTCIYYFDIHLIFDKLCSI